MSAFTDFCSQIADWNARGDWSASLVTSFIRMAEAKFNRELRVKYMTEYATGLIYDRVALLPGDFLEATLVRVANPSGADGWLPLRYKPNDEFLNLVDKYSNGHYTIIGTRIHLGGPPDATNGIQYEITYFAEVPTFGDAAGQAANTWIIDKYPDMYLWGALMHSGLHAVGEEQTSMNFKQLCEDAIGKLNAEWLRAKASGSRLGIARRRSFG